jgi:ketosteroid isomerase-like protein
MKRLSLIPLALLLGSLFIAHAATEEDLRQVEKDWAAAVVANDFAKIEQFMSPDIIYGHSSGAVETKDEYMTRLRGGKQQYEAIEYHKIMAKVSGNTALTHSLLRMAGKNNGVPFNNELMMLHVWVQRDGRWQLAGHQTALMPK